MCGDVVHAHMRQPLPAVKNLKETLLVRLEYKSNYMELFKIVIFFVVYLLVVMMKTDITPAFAMRQKIVDSLFGQVL